MHTDWSLFLGRLHPLIVHLPIGIIFFAAFLNLLNAYKKNAALTYAINIGLLAGTIGAAFASLSGYLLSTSGWYHGSTLFPHKWVGIAVVILTFIVWLLRTNHKIDIRILMVTLSNWLFMISIILITIGGHLGGKLTHEEGYFTRYMPALLKPAFGVHKQAASKKTFPPLDSVIVYRDIIQPIFTVKCMSCHNTEIRKGELDLSGIEGILKGGKTGNSIVSGNVEKSELYHRIILSPESSKFMPADGRPSLLPIEINFIKWWIETGADYQKNILALGADEKTKYLIGAYLGIHEENSKEIKLPEVGPADSVILRQLKEMNVIVRSLTSKSNLLEVSFVQLQQSDPSKLLSAFEKLSAIKEQLYRLDASNCRLTKDAMKMIAGCSRLTKLEIQKNSLTDESIESLGDLKHVEVLNAGQNLITDKSISVFTKLTALKKINLWQTKLTEEGIKNLQKQLPGVVIYR